MLFDPSWERKNTDPFSLTSLINWLRTQPADATYVYSDPEQCALGLWTKSIDANRKAPQQGPNSFTYIVNGQKVDLSVFHLIVSGGRDSVWDRTKHFGSALKRAEEARMKEIINVA